MWHDFGVNHRAIDEAYGLEPVIEVDERRAFLDGFLDVECPHCGETYGLAVDLASGDQSFVEDCTVCCRPIACTLTVRGRRVKLATARVG
jgi:hypothetical protein